MSLKNTETVLAELLERVARAGTDRGEISSYEYQMIHALDDYLGFLKDWPRGPAFDAEVIRMSRTVEAFLGTEVAERPARRGYSSDPTDHRFEEECSVNLLPALGPIYMPRIDHCRHCGQHRDRHAN